MARSKMESLNRHPGFQFKDTELREIRRRGYNDFS